MNKLKFICFGIVFLYLPDFWCQNWQSIPKSNYNNVVPSSQFIIDEFSNGIWLVNENKVSVIKDNGLINDFNSQHLGELFSGDRLQFCFTSEKIYFMKYTFGLFEFSGIASTLLLNEIDCNKIQADDDTIYLSRSGTNLKFITGEVIDTYFSGANISVKNSQLYTDNGLLGKRNGMQNQTLSSDPHYLFAPINFKKFQRHTDSIFVATKKGVMFAYNYDILDTITPNNTSNMPSPNVLEIEFDHEDKLWAVFGDASDVPFSLAKLEGSTWVNQYDATNSPIDFNNYLGMEIDTLGNVWVVDNMNLHTLLTESSPAWLSTVELKPTATFSLQPNPTNDYIELTTEKPTGEYQLLDAQGRIIQTEKIHSSHQLIDLSTLQSGVYFVAIDGNVKRFVKQ
jgi:hypothetical protein